MRSPPESLRRGLVRLAIATSCGTVGVLAYFVAIAQYDATAKETVAQVASQRAAVLRLRCEAVLRTLVTLRARMASDDGDGVTRAAFRSFVRELMPLHPEILAFEWVPRVWGVDLAAFEAQAARDGAPGYVVHGRAPDGSVAAIPPALVHFPVHFAEPNDGNETVLGFDIYSNERRRRAVNAALQSGAAELSDPLQLVQERGLATGYLAMLAVPEREHGGSGPALAGFRGLVMVALRAEDMLRDAPEHDSADRSASVTFRVIDESDPRHPLELSVMDAPSLAGAVAWCESVIDFGGRRWRLLAYPPAGLVGPARSVQAGLIAFAATTLGLALTMLVRHGAHRRRKREIRDRDRILRSVCSGLHEGVVVADEHGKFVFWNHAAERMVGIGEEDRPSSEWTAHYGIFLPDGVTPYPPDDLPLVRAARGEYVQETDLFIRNASVPDGRWLRISAAPIADDAGAHRGGVVLFRDVTDRKQTEEHVKRLVAVVEQTADGVLMTDESGRIEYVNRAFEELTGWTSAEVLGKTPRILKSGMHEETFYSDLWHQLVKGKVFRDTVINSRKDGSTWCAEQTITPILDASHRITHFVSVMKDVTERRRMLQQETEIRMAAKIQEQLYPRSLHASRAADLGGFVLSASETCGDYYDWMMSSDGGLSIVVADVVGHGLGAALIMAETRAYLRMLALESQPPAEAVKRLDVLLRADLVDGQFVTMILLRVDVARRRLTYANAGHPPGRILDSKGKLKATLPNTGYPLGLWPEAAQVDSGVLVIEEGDLVVLLSDGITECRNTDGQFLTEAPVLKLVKAHASEPVPSILARVRKMVLTFTGGGRPQDDATIVIFRVRLVPSSRRVPGVQDVATPGPDRLLGSPVGCDPLSLVESCGGRPLSGHDPRPGGESTRLGRNALPGPGQAAPLEQQEQEGP